MSRKNDSLPWVGRSKCKESGKIQYGRVEAGARLRDAMMLSIVFKDDVRREQNMYQCVYCNAWHLTKQHGKYTEIYRESIMESMTGSYVLNIKENE